MACLFCDVERLNTLLRGVVVEKVRAFECREHDDVLLALGGWGLVQVVNGRILIRGERYVAQGLHCHCLKVRSPYRQQAFIMSEDNIATVSFETSEDLIFVFNIDFENR